LKQLTIISGKGGTGKTTLTANMAAQAENAIFADCDVDASNLHLLLNPEVKETIEFKGLNLAVINEEKCTRCGLCEEYCRFDAISDYKVDPIHCEGCKVCVQICPVKAIDFVERICGHAYISDTKYGTMVHARLIPGMENSGKLVTLVRQNATRIAEEQGRDFVLVDGPPGLGCPVIASLADIDMAMVVVEPTLSGIHDLERALGLLDHFEITPLVCVNKYDLNLENTQQIQGYCSKNNVQMLDGIPFDSRIVEALVNAMPIVDYDPDTNASIALKKMWRELREILEL
jgi:MinD superfamily P-loop ATPase